MNHKDNILFIGTFLSKQRGSLCVSEKLSGKLSELGFQCKLVSRQQNKFIRLFEIIISLFFTNARIIHIDVYSGQAFIIAEVASWIGSLLRKKVILTLHGGALPDFYSKNAERIRQAFKRSAIITTPSRMLHQFFDEKGFRLRYIPNSIDLQYFPYNRDSVRPYSLLWVRAFHPIYNPHLAVQTLAKVRESFPEATLTMIGPDKGMLKETKELITKLKLDHAVEIIGPVPNTELYKYYQTHAVFLNTTSYESFGVAVLEAAACGIPIVSTKVGEIPLLWEEEEEMLMVDGFNAEKFTLQVNRILAEVGLYEKMSRNAHLKAKKFDVSGVLNQWLKIM